jgi:hypothetical protein
MVAVYNNLVWLIQNATGIHQLSEAEDLINGYTEMYHWLCLRDLADYALVKKCELIAQQYPVKE